MAVALEVVTGVRAAPELVFDLARDVDVHVASMAGSRERTIAGVTGGRLGLGDTVTWRARHFGIHWTMTSRVTEWDRPRRFVDEQVRGPFAMFRHEHLFEPSLDGGTTMIDRIEFRAPAGVLGRVAERLLLARYIRELIETRNDYLRTSSNDS